MGDVVELKQGCHPAQLEQNQQAILTNAARYATIRRLAMLSEDEQKPIYEAMEAAGRSDPTLTPALFDKVIDVARAMLNSQDSNEAA